MEPLLPPASIIFRLPATDAESIDSLPFPWSGNIYFFLQLSFSAELKYIYLLFAIWPPHCPFLSFPFPSSILDLCIPPSISLPDSAAIWEPLT